MITYGEIEGMNGFMEILNYGNIDYWKLLDLPSVDSKHPVAKDATLAMIKYAFFSRFAIVKTLIEKHDCTYDYSTLLDIVNAYANLSDPEKFYKYNCYRQEECAYDISDEYYGYENVFTKDLSADDQNIFVEFVWTQLNYFSDLIKKCQITSKEELNILQALELALKETYLNESSKKVKDDNNLTHKLK